MFFLGTTFFGGRHASDYSPTRNDEITEVVLHECDYDQVFVSQNKDLSYNNMNDAWDYSTIMNAKFDDGKLDAGNSGFSLSTTSEIRVKRREVGTFEWTTIYTKEIHSVEDFKIVLQDKFCKSETEYEYMVVSVSNGGVENSYITKDVTSKFDGVFICDKDTIYGTDFDIDFANTTIDTGATVLRPLNSKYATIVRNGDAHYEEGSVTGTFVQFDSNYQNVLVKEGVEYRKNVKTWLDNGLPKILKFYDGRMWLVGINGSIADNGADHNTRRQLTFQWTEIGDCDSMTDLYNNGLSDVLGV